MTRESDAERWRRVEELLGAALEAAGPAERDALLDAACAGEPELRREVDSLLAAHERSGAVDRMAARLAPLAAEVRDAAGPARRSLQGRTVGRFRVGAPVGGGGMGVVHEALDAQLGRTVALKFLRSRFDADDSAAERFRMEARAVAALEHPNICTIHEIGETEDGQLYLAMPLYDGETLQRRIARGPLPVAEAVGIAVQVARGLEKAHARGIVHRDVKPSNVLVTGDGTVKLLDFGIAKLADVTLTGAAGPLGTAAYMSPEQMRGEAVDHRSDIWSLGVVLYEMLAGRRPFAGETAAAVAAAIQRAEPEPVAARRPDVPPELDLIVSSALASLPEQRYQSARELEAELLALDLAPDAAPGGPSTGPGRRARPVRRRGGGGRHARTAIAAATAAAAVLALAVALSPVGRSWWRGATPPAATAAPATIAVLPFADRSPGQDQEYFSDGITEEIITTLGRVEGLRVASRTSAFAFKDRGLDVRTVGARLGVATVLEGSVRREGERLRITAQLVNVADGYQLWSDSYDRDAGDAFEIQREIARAIAQTLRARLVGGGAGGAAVGDMEATGAGNGPDAIAYDLYLKGRFAWYSRTGQGLQSAARYFEQAVARDPGYARAHAGLADAYAVLGFYDFVPPAQAFPRAAAAARRAMALDPTLAAPHATLGYVALYHDWDLARGEAEFRRAIELDPNYSTAHQWYANLLAAAGRFPEAEREMRRAQEIDPLSLIASAALGWVLHHAGDHAAALAQFDQTLELAAGYALAHLWKGWTLQAMDSLPEAVGAHRRAVAIADSGDIFVASLARSLALAGERAESERLLRRLVARAAGGGYVPSYEVAKVYDALGRPDDALAWLERAYDERAHSMVFLRVDPQLAGLRSDPRFRRLVERVFAG